MYDISYSLKVFSRSLPIEYLKGNDATKTPIFKVAILCSAFNLIHYFHCLMTVEYKWLKIGTWIFFQKKLSFKNYYNNQKGK